MAADGSKTGVSEMSLVQRVLENMHPRIIYRPADIGAAIGLDAGEAGRILKMLSQGGVSRGNPGFRLSPQAAVSVQAAEARAMNSLLIDIAQGKA